MTLYQQHKQKWGDCTLCDLCKVRRKTVLARGSVPCDVLFTGEAPGASEDVIGRPFVGPAGRLLDRIIDTAIATVLMDPEPTLGFTNLVCCIPKDETGDKVGEPPKWAIDACAPRLQEFVELCSPKLIVAVGKLASDTLLWMDDMILSINQSAFISIIHPAAILRMDVSQQGLAVQRCVVALADAIEEL